MQREQVASIDPDFPRFRVGVDTGPALVGSVGPGIVVIGANTYRPIADLVEAEPLGGLTLKGEDQPGVGGSGGPTTIGTSEAFFYHGGTAGVAQTAEQRTRNA